MTYLVDEGADLQLNFAFGRSSHCNRDPNRSPLSDPPRPIQCSASDGSKILCTKMSQDTAMKQGVPKLPDADPQEGRASVMNGRSVYRGPNLVG